MKKIKFYILPAFISLFLIASCTDNNGNNGKGSNTYNNNDNNNGGVNDQGEGPASSLNSNPGQHNSNNTTHDTTSRRGDSVRTTR
jgi:hypothetical protein